MINESTITLAYLYNNLSLGGWSFVFSLFVAFFLSGYSISNWYCRKKIESLHDRLDQIRQTPRVQITLQDDRVAISKHAGLLKYTFTQEPFIDPEILDEMAGWLSDHLPCYAAVDLEGAMKSDRFHDGKLKINYGDIEPDDINAFIDSILAPPSPIVSKHKEREYTGYRYIGMSPSGVHVVKHFASGGGSGIFSSVLLIVFETQYYLINEASEQRNAILMKVIGSISLGDRYSGEIALKGKNLVIEANRNHMPHSELWKEGGIIEIP